MKALIQGHRVVQVEEKEFPVHKDLVWHDCPDDCTPEWTYIDQNFAAPVVPKQKPVEKSMIERKLDALIKAMLTADKSDLEEIAGVK